MTDILNHIIRDQLGISLFRNDSPPESITFFAHYGECRYCNGGLVKMARDDRTFALKPKECWCLQCGQPYFVEIDDIVAWEQEQWRQKASL